ncbi:MAG: DUF1294 domain-containing protein [Bacteroidales bacterium]|jgi:uncharacterized membrane protein YsdA (DUF1294 family)|nr:DUF1294 domain-containing protein [Bacteroidales bacterium]
MRYLVIYLIIINIVSGGIFFYDKRLSRRTRRRRISEAFLHFLELIGGVVGILIIMHGEHHKNKKPAYYIVSYVIFALWTGFMFMMIKEVF